MHQLKASGKQETAAATSLIVNSNKILSDEVVWKNFSASDGYVDDDDNDSGNSDNGNNDDRNNDNGDDFGGNCDNYISYARQ